MKYLAETENIERDGPQADAEDWDSLSDRVRKARKQKTLMQQHRGNNNDFYFGNIFYVFLASINIGYFVVSGL